MRFQTILTRARRRLRSASGAIDLASIMVGVIIIGIIGATITASVFTVIGWSQDKAAAQNLDAVKTAQSVARAKGADTGSPAYLPLAQLISAGYLPSKSASAVNVGTANNGACWVAVSKSGTGKVMLSEDAATNPVEYKAGATTTACPVDLTALVAPLGSTPSADVDWSKFTWATQTPNPILPGTSFAYSGSAILAVSPSTYAYSVDGGATFLRAAAPWSSGSPQIVASRTGGAVVAFGGISGDTKKYAFFSEDGTTWTKSAVPNTVGAAISVQGKTIVASNRTADSKAGFALSTDGGASWTTLNSPVSSDDVTGTFVSADGSTAALVTSLSEVWTTRNSGISWSKVTVDGAAAWSPPTPFVGSSNGQHLIFTDFNAKSFISHDFGATWTQMSQGGGMRISDDGQKIVSSSQTNGYAFSSDGGKTFAKVTPPAGATVPYPFVSGISPDGRTFIALDYNKVWRASVG